MPLSTFLNNTVKAVKKNSPEIFTAIGVGGVIMTSYLTAKAAFRAADLIRNDEMIGGVSDDPKQVLKERAKLTWKLYIPAAASGAVTVACIIGSQKSSSRRTAAAFTAYSMAERAFSEYKGKVIEQIGETKEQKIRDEIAQDQVNRLTENNRQVYVLESGEVLWCERFTGRFFKSTMEKIQTAKNEINSMINHELYVSLDEFYDLVGLDHTSNSYLMGWESDRLLELQISTTIGPNNQPCMAFEYNYVKPLRED